MSKGLGKLQREILSLIRSEEGITVEEVRWRIHERRSSVSVKKLPSSLNISVRNAVFAMEDRGLIRIEERYLESFDECVKVYPSKSLVAEVKLMRETLLPHLKRGMDDGEVFIRYGESENEEYLLDNMSHDERLTLDLLWRDVMLRARNIYGAKEEHSEVLFKLICRGHYLFERGWVSAKFPMSYAIEQVLEFEQCDDEFTKLLIKFKEQMAPLERMGNIELRSYVHTFVSVSTTGSCQLKSKTAELLYKHEKGYLDAKAGVGKPFEESVGFPRHFHQGVNPKVTQAINKLFDHYVFHKFRFLYCV